MGPVLYSGGLEGCVSLDGFDCENTTVFIDLGFAPGGTVTAQFLGPDPLKDLLAAAMAGLHAGRLEPRMGSVIAYLGTALLKAIETTDYQERIEALEESDKKD